MTDKRKSSGFVAAVKRLCRRGLALLIAGTVALGSTSAYALSLGSSMENSASLQKTGSTSQAGTISGTWTLDLWHYSGGYWKVGNKGSEKIRIDDDEIQALDQFLQANQQATFSVSISSDLAELIRSGERGKDWDVTFSGYGGSDPAKIFVEPSPKEVTITASGKVEFSVTPVFHFTRRGESLQDYVPGMTVTVPLVDRIYGYNIYSVFGNGQSAVQGLGYYNEDDPSDTGSNAIHPSFIAGKSGALQSGHAITLGTKIVDSAGYSIGSGTFAAAGACGLHFDFPVSLVFTDLRDTEDPGNGQDPDDLPGGNSGGNGNPSGNGQNGDPGGNGDGPGGPGNNGSDPGGANDNEDPGNNGDPNGNGGNNIDPNDPSGPNGNPGSGSDPGNPADPAIPADSSDIAALDAILDLPAVSYVGHDVEARDVSLYEVDGKTMTAARAAELGLGKSSFAIVQSGAGSIRKSGKTGAIAVFSKSGTFQVKLTATAANGLKDTDTRSIRILKTPAILEDLGGVQKENRKQTLRITVAQDPRNPVNELSIKLTDTASGESITV
ncbi:MAG: hypothetical protein IKN20_00255, partial [Firmicutes bacterium]|nr:hypothetical protein [Bacillota bacterium]